VFPTLVTLRLLAKHRVSAPWLLLLAGASVTGWLAHWTLPDLLWLLGCVGVVVAGFRFVLSYLRLAQSEAALREQMHRTVASIRGSRMALDRDARSVLRQMLASRRRSNSSSGSGNDMPSSGNDMPGLAPDLAPDLDGEVQTSGGTRNTSGSRSDLETAIAAGGPNLSILTGHASASTSTVYEEQRQRDVSLLNQGHAGSSGPEDEVGEHDSDAGSGTESATSEGEPGVI